MEEALRAWIALERNNLQHNGFWSDWDAGLESGRERQLDYLEDWLDSHSWGA